MSSYSYLYYLHEYKLCRCARTSIMPPSRMETATRIMLMCGFFWRSNRDHYFLVSVTRALASSIIVRTYVSPKFNKQMHYHDIIPYRGTLFFFSVFFVLGQIMTPIWKYCLAKFYVINLSIHEDPKNNWRVPFKIQYFARFSLVSLSIHPSSRRGAERIRLGRGALEPPPKDGAGTKPFDPEFQFRESHAEAETTTNS